MRFRIEIVRDDASTTAVIYSTTVDEISPNRAKRKAAALLDMYRGGGAKKARVLNDRHEELFTL